MPAADYVSIKSSWARITEFLALLGGLYTTCLAIGFTVWFLMTLSLPGDIDTAGAPAGIAGAVAGTPAGAVPAGGVCSI